MRQNDLSRSGTVAVHRPSAATHQINKAMQLRLRMMKPSGAGPTIGACKNRSITKLFFNTLEFERGQF